MHRVDLIILATYLACILLFGLYSGRSVKSAKDYTTGGGRLPTWALGLSIFGTYVSAFSFLALPGKSYSSNWNAFAFSLSIPLIAWLACSWLVPFYRKLNNISAYEHLEKRFGPWARLYAVACYLFIQLGRIGGILYLLAVALKPVTGLSIPTLIIAASVIVIIYTFFGGMEAVVWTDVIQSIILIAGAITCAILIPMSLPAEESFFEIAKSNKQFSLGSLKFDLVSSTFWVVLIYGLFENLRNFSADQSYIQRYQSAKDTKAAKKTIWIGALLYLPVSAVFLFIGTSLFAYYQGFPEQLPADLKPDEVFPHYIATSLPIGVSGLLIAGVASAAQSTISSSLNCGATLLLEDVYLRFFNTRATQRQSLQFIRWVSAIFGITGTGVALAMINVKTALDVWWKIAGVFGAGILGIYLLGRLTKASSTQAAIATLLGIVVIGAHTLHPFLHPLMTIVLGTLTILISGYSLSFFSTDTQKSP